MKKTELFYLVYVSTVVGVAFYCIYLLFQKYTMFSLVRTVADTCCQFIIKVSQTGVQLAGISVLYLLMTAIGFLSLKTFFSLIKTHLMLKRMCSAELRTSNQEVSSICHKHQIPISRVLVIKSPKHIVFTVGVWRPKIVISTSLINSVKSQELEAILLHEAHHLNHAHPLLFMVGEVVGRSFNVVPIVQEVANLLKHKLEQEADEWAIQVQGSSVHLNRAFLKLRHLSERSDYFPSFSSLRGSDRMKYLAGEPYSYQQLSKLNVFVSVIVLAFVMILIKTPIYAQAENSESDLPQSTMCEAPQSGNFYCGSGEPLNQSRQKYRSSLLP